MRCASSISSLTAKIHRAPLGPLEGPNLSPGKGCLAWLVRRRVWAGGLIGEVCRLIGTGSGQGRVRPVGQVTRRGIRPRTTRRMA